MSNSNRSVSKRSDLRPAVNGHVPSPYLIFEKLDLTGKSQVRQGGGVRSTCPNPITPLRYAALKLVICTVLLGTSGCSGQLERGADLAINVVPEAIFFDNVAVGTVVQGTATIEHTGPSGTLQLGQPSLVGSGEFRILGLSQTALLPGETSILRVEYSPTDQASDSGAVALPHNIPNTAPYVISLVATPQRPVIEATPYRLDFDGVEAETTKTLPLTLRNTGTYPADIDRLGLDLFGGAPFTLPDGLEFPMRVDVGESLDVNITFSPINTGDDTAYEAQLRVDSPQLAIDGRVIPITGVSRHQMMGINPGIVTFGWVTMGTQALRDVVIRNEGLQSLEISSIKLVDTAATVGALGLPESPFVLAPLQSRTITITFKPLEANEDEKLGSLVIDSNDYVVPTRQVQITGRGARPAISFIPESPVDFGIVAVQHRHVRPLQIVNLGDIPLLIDELQITEGQDLGFEVIALPTLPLLLAPNGSALVQLGYTNPGNMDGLTWGRLSVSSNDPVSPDAGVDLRARNTGFPGCEPRFDPPLVHFGTLASGSQTTRELRVRNDGSMPCIYKNASIVDCTAQTGLCQTQPGVSDSFFVQSPTPAENSVILWDQPLSLQIKYKPALETSSDGAIPVITLQNGTNGSLLQYSSAAGGITPVLRGDVGTAGVRVNPNSVTWPLTTVGCVGTSREIEVTRVGPQPIDLKSIDTTLCGDHFTFESLPDVPVPLYVDAGDAVSVFVQFTPTQPGLHQCVIPFEPSEPNAGVGTLELTGVAAESPQRIDVFEQVDDVDVDILFVVDNSGSMGDEQATLSAGFDGFIAQAQVWNVKYQIGVVSTDLNDEGRLLGAMPWVDNASTSVFADSVLLGTEGSGDERGLQTAWLALQPDMLVDYGIPCINNAECNAQFANSQCVKGICGGPNRGFVREEALLAIIWVSDEQDHACMTPVIDFVDYFKTLKGNNVKGYAIVGNPKSPADPIGGCGGGGNACDPCDECSFGGNPFGGPGQGAEAGTRYAEAADALGGFWSSICDFGAEGVDQPSLLEEIGKDAFKPLDTFELSEPAVPDSVQVFVDDDSCDDFIYDPASNTIAFPNLESHCFPGPNALIEVIYDAPCAL